MSPEKKLRIERALEKAKTGSFFERYRLMKDRLLNVEYEHWAAGFPQGNNHGRGHITRVLEHLDQLLGAKPLAFVGAYELYLAMMAILYHDVGILRQRKGHEQISKDLLEGDENDEYIINEIDKEIIGAAVVSHSSSRDIDIEAARLSPEEIIGDHKVRPRMIAALVRLADELDEDYRRADPILQKRLNIPVESEFFWRFSQRIRGVQPNLVAKRIDINLALKQQDTTHYGPVPGGKARHFVVFVAEKLAKINEERVKVNRFLPPELQSSGLHIDVKPFRNHPTWTSPRTFVFNDKTTHQMFLQSFPEILDEPSRDEIAAILGLMKDGQLDEAEAKLDSMASVLSDLPVETQMRVLYDRACVYSMKAANLPKPLPRRQELLDQSTNQIREWFERGKAGSFKSLGRTADAEVHRLATDGDLNSVLTERRAELRKIIPDSHWPRTGGGGGGGGCVPLGTLIETAKGKRRVEELRPGDEIISLRLGPPNLRVPTIVGEIISGRSSECVQLSDEWIVTPRQPVRTDKGWTEAGKLRRGDKVINGVGKFIQINNPKEIKGYFEIFELSVSSPEHNFVANGLLCHNKTKRGIDTPF